MQGKRVLFVLSGGGMPGLDIHAGLLAALWNANITATHLTGCSAGAIAAAAIASGMEAPQYVNLIRSLQDSAIRQPRAFWKARPWLPWIMDSARISAIIQHELAGGYSDLDKPLGVVATNVDTGRLHWFGSPGFGVPAGLHDSVLASMSIHGIFPEVCVDGQGLFADGGPRANLPLPRYWRGFDFVFLLIASPPVKYERRTSWISKFILNAHWAMQDQIDDVLATTGTLNTTNASFVNTVAGYPDRTTVVRMWPDLGERHGLLHFDHKLIAGAYEYGRLLLRDLHVAGVTKEART